MRPNRPNSDHGLTCTARLFGRVSQGESGVWVVWSNREGWCYPGRAFENSVDERQHHSSSSSISSSLHSHVTFLEWCDKIKLSNLLLPRKTGTIKSLRLLQQQGRRGSQRYSDCALGDNIERQTPPPGVLLSIMHIIVIILL